MKYSFLSLFLIITMMTAPAVSAQTATTEPSPKVTTKVTPTSVVDSAVEKLKEKVASKVSQMRKNQKGTSGIVTAISGDEITMTSIDKVSYEVKLDDTLTKYYQVAGAAIKEIKKADIKKDSYIIVSGPVFDKSITANVIYVDERFIIKTGKITEANSGDFTLKVMTEDKETYTLDIESKTTQTILNIKTIEPEKVGFSKLKEGDTIYFVVKQGGKVANSTRYSAEKIFVIPQEYFIK